MKKFLLLIGLVISLVSIFLLITKITFAKEGISIDVAGIFGSEPSDGLGSTFGFGIGAGKEMEENVQVRVDINYYNWSENEGGVDSEYRRIPIFFGSRYLQPMERIRLYGEAGLEISFDKAKAGMTIGSGSYSVSASAEESEIHFGLTPGFGVEYDISDNLTAGLNLRYHIITDSYFTTGMSIGYNY